MNRLQTARLAKNDNQVLNMLYRVKLGDLGRKGSVRNYYE
ncbi:hypothetical protein NPIL_9191, partial [Nephila pilipes]